MNVVPTELPGLVVIEPKVFGDARGYFAETFQAARYREAGLRLDFVQDNISRSRKGTLRGLHYQLERPQGKLVTVLSGAVFDVAVDLRSDSPTFGRWFGLELSDENHRQLYVPPGFGHGFCVLSERADFFYKCTDYYNPADEQTLKWDDPTVNVAWPDAGERILSPKDEAGKPWNDAAKYGPGWVDR